MDLLTIAPDGEGSAEIEVKRSRFLAVVARIDSEDGAKALLGQARREHHDARHHCSAFVLHVNGQGDRTRSSDDGEPSGTAGLPILQVLLGAGLSDVAAVVTRYFGGTLLGAGGLVRAYSAATAAAVAAAVTVRRRRLELLTLAVDHAVAGRVESELRSRGVVITGTEYGPSAVLTLAVPAFSDEVAGTVASVTAGAGVLRPAGFRWVDVRS
ncbi:uncharacterized protein, YigZ family [Nakamurella panacisegetis]|uniref:Uncharacterized protein, YigZ family n=1 Tax=Nakamurella panacisegetis TaxID=1090615 RepID=A0A1H0JE79_9ACTN|nr:uncharacterized protein, YigZ family [Nakamurella panacisegetis]